MHSNEKVIKSLDDFVLVKIDVDEQRSVAQDLGVESIPLLVFFDSDGKEKGRHVGGHSADSLLKLLDGYK